MVEAPSAADAPLGTPATDGALPAEEVTPAPLPPQGAIPGGAPIELPTTTPRSMPATLEVIESLPDVTASEPPAAPVAALAESPGPAPAEAAARVDSKIPNPFVQTANPAAAATAAVKPAAPSLPGTTWASKAFIPTSSPSVGTAAYEYQGDSPTAQVAGGPAVP